MEFLLESDARISARLDTMVDRLGPKTERARIADSAEGYRVFMREAIGRMREIKERIEAAAATLSDRAVERAREQEAR